MAMVTGGRRCIWDTGSQVVRVWVSSTWEVLATWLAHCRLCCTLQHFGGYHKKCDRGKSCTLCIIISFLRKLTNFTSPLKPIELWRKLTSISSEFHYTREEDAHDYTQFLLEVLRRKIIDTALPKFVFWGSKITTPLDAIFWCQQSVQ